jgi:large subunit ribosomal protein L10
MTNAKVRLKKRQNIDELEKIISEASVAIITNYRGIKTSELTSLRVKLRQNKMGYKVVKNTLARKAAGGAKKAKLESVFDGPIAMAYGYGDDVAAPAKLLLEHITVTKSNMTVAGGFLGDKPLSVAEVTVLSKLPPKKALIAMMLGGIQAPISRLVGTLNAPIQGLVTVLNGQLEKLQAK